MRRVSAYIIIAASLLIPFRGAPAQATQAIGIVGAYYGNIFVDNSTPYAALINSSGAVQSLSLPLTSGYVSTVSMNASGTSFLGGQYVVPFNLDAFYAFTDSSGNITSYVGPHFDKIIGGSINDSQNTLVAGNNGGGFATRISPTGTFTTVAGSAGGLSPASINNAGAGVVGGLNYAAYFLPNDNTPNQVLDIPYSAGSVDINQSGNFIVGGTALSSGFFNTYLASGELASTNSFSSGSINSVAINDGNLCLVGGSQGSAPYLELCEIDGTTLSLFTGSLPASGAVYTVTLNNEGYGIIGGHSSAGAYGAYLDARGAIYNLSGLPTGGSAAVQSVSINDWGVALISGTTDGTNIFAALVYPPSKVSFLALTPPPPPPSITGGGTSVSIRNFIPYPVTGNNLTFAQYINDQALSRTTPFFFSLGSQGDFEEALEAASPTRNACSFFSAANNLFYVNQSLELHLRNYRHTRRSAKQRFVARVVQKSLSSSESVLASGFSSEELTHLLTKDSPTLDQLTEEKKKNKIGCSSFLWVQAIGAYASQKAQKQTVAFNPALGGIICGFEPVKIEHGKFGIGAAYTFTRVHEDQNAGSSYINQEYAYLYGGWSNNRFHFDAAFWGALFQTRQEREIHLPQASYLSSSHPGGFLFSPHGELGFDYSYYFGTEKRHQLLIDPFVMLDWPFIRQEKFTETGPGPFNVTQIAQHASFRRIEAGIRFYETFRCGSWLLTVEEKGSYVNRHPFHIGTVTAALVGAPGFFTMETLTGVDELGAVELSLILEPLEEKSPSFSLSYQGELGSSYSSQQMTFDFTWEF